MSHSRCEFFILEEIIREGTARMVHYRNQTGDKRTKRSRTKQQQEQEEKDDRIKQEVTNFFEFIQKVIKRERIF